MLMTRYRIILNVKIGKDLCLIWQQNPFLVGMVLGPNQSGKPCDSQKGSFGSPTSHADDDDIDDDDDHNYHQHNQVRLPNIRNTGGKKSIHQNIFSDMIFYYLSLKVFFVMFTLFLFCKIEAEIFPGDKKHS